ncbi:MAG TPA: response regulator transcription factor [Bryobacteraceae bacterium]|nr:response regulator transcription factor [Bryobacteraceae bacterium]
MRILVIEDERKLASAVKQGLEADGYSVELAHTGEEGFYLICKQTFDLAILDVMLPGRDGFEILGSLRQQGIRIPILLLTARDALEDRVLGLDTGADDYLVKPFAFPELLARIRALLRRGSTIETGSSSKVADLEIDLTHRHVSRDGQTIELTSKEYEILEYLFINKGRVVSREMLARDIWKDIARQTPLDNVIDVHVTHLRRKIDDGFSKKLLHTVRGLGFVLREEIA